MGDEVFGSLKFSYNWLSSDTTRACFLYCALYPEDYEILVDDLIEHWMAEGLINETGSIQTDKDRGHAYLKELKDACMIESIRDDDKYVKMHDLIRDLAINITREPPLFMVKAGLQLKESPEEEEWVESLERVSLMRTQIEAFQGQPNCPRLSTLLLQSSYGSVIFFDTFFKHMHNLRVLNLSNSGIKSLPDSLSDLVNLHALILTDCYQLACLPSLAKLHKLKLLKLGGLSSLKELPHGLENLVKLRHLDISHGGWRRFPSGALSKMSRLEILFMDRSRWSLSYGNNGSNGDAEVNSTFGEIVRLKKLTKFSANFADVLTFNNYIKKADEFEFLRNFDYFNFILSYEYCGFNVINLSKEKVALPGTANYLVIGACNFIQLSDIFHWDDLRQLIYCGIHRCNKIERIVESNGVMNGEIVFPSLETLHLTGLHSFRGLCKEKVHEETLKNLRRLLIHTCHKLKYLIPIDLLVNNLQNLEEISVRDCEEMEHIISGNTDSAMVSLPKLKELHLYRLRALTSICQGNELVCDSLCKIKIHHCPKLKKLPSLPVSIATVVTEEWWKTLEWEDPQLKEQLQPSFQDPDDTLR
ncbi:putative leucine-rich repeat domain superfamily, winged helix-like DNA-binding domain superfamily [Dioscorea sansibarensis]